MSNYIYLYIVIFAGALLWIFWTFFRGFRPDSSWKGNRIRVLFLVGFAVVAGHVAGTAYGAGDPEIPSEYRSIFLERYIREMQSAGGVIRGSAEMARVMKSPEFLQKKAELTEKKARKGDIFFSVSMALVLIQLILLYPHKKIPVQRQILLAKLPIIPLFVLLFIGKLINTEALAAGSNLNRMTNAANLILTDEIPSIVPEADFHHALHALEEEYRNQGPGLQLLPARYVLALYPSVKSSSGVKALARRTQEGWSAILEEKNMRWILPLPDPEKGTRYTVSVHGEEFRYTAGEHLFRASRNSKNGQWEMTELKKIKPEPNGKAR